MHQQREIRQVDLAFRGFHFQRLRDARRHDKRFQRHALQRIQRLIDDGVITGSGYNVNPKLLGYSTCTFIGLTLERGSMYRTVVPELLKIKEVVECHFTTGHYTMMIKVYARDNEHLMSLVNDRIQHIEGVAATETLISLEQSISRTLPIYFDE